MQQRGVDACSGRHEGPGVALLTEQPPVAAARFDPQTLAHLDRELEVDIETIRDDGSPKRTTIWVVVDEGEAFARSWKGDDGVWYRHVRARPDVVLHVAGGAVAARAVSATDDDSVERTSRGFEKKYAGDMSTPAMVAPAIAHTTIRLEPR